MRQKHFIAAELFVKVVTASEMLMDAGATTSYLCGELSRNSGGFLKAVKV
jgi:hypothetical protein